ncbi:MAG: polysaccharide deacetylase family protein [Hyphomonadaceae bacterium]
MAQPLWTYAPSRSAPAKVQRRVVQWRKACQADVAPDRPIVSFTFDDFPKSALNGADIIEKHGGRAGFYACTTFLGQRSPVMGEMFDGATLNELSVRGHEIGAHTHSHLDCARARLEKVERDIGENLVALAEAGYSENISAFAYPFGETTYSAKRWVGEVFATGRGILPGVNIGDTDRSQLRAIELGGTEMHRKRALAALKTCIEAKGWLFFFTHDVSKSPSKQGAPSELIAELAKQAVEGGAVLASPTLGAVLSGIID